jgi:biotin carboxyl carrier protein
MGDSSVQVTTTLVGTVVAVLAGAGDEVRAGNVVALVESMKLHHDVTSPVDGRVASVAVSVGDTVGPGSVIVEVIAGAVGRDGRGVGT